MKIASLPCGHQVFDGQQVLGCPECKRQNRQRSAQQQRNSSPRTKRSRIKPKTNARSAAKAVQTSSQNGLAAIAGFFIACLLTHHYLTASFGGYVIAGSLGAYVVGRFYKLILLAIAAMFILAGMSMNQTQEGQPNPFEASATADR